MKLKYAFDLSLLGSDPTPSGAIVGHKKMEVVWTLVVLVGIFSDRLFFLLHHEEAVVCWVCLFRSY